MKIKTFLTIFCFLIFYKVSLANNCCPKFIDVAAGEYHTLALARDGSLWACGGDPYDPLLYQLGLGNISASVLSLQRIGGLDNVIAFDAGWQHSLAVDSNHFCWSFGYDDEGQLGNGPGQQNSSVPIKVHGLNNDANGLRNIVKVSGKR